MSDTTVLILSLFAAIIPTFIYVVLIYWVDRYEKEPWWLLISAFLWGAIPSILFAYFVNTVLSIPFYALAGEGTGDALAAALVAPPVEESIKGMALLGILFLWRHEIDSPLDGIIYGAMVGVGFAMVENVFYFLNEFESGGVEAWQINIAVRTLFGLNHALFTSMTGLGIAVARLSPTTITKWVAPVVGWGTAVFLHFVHNATVSTGTILCALAFVFDYGGVLLTIGIIIWALIQEQQWIKQHLSEEVNLGTLTMQQYKMACSGVQRTWHPINLLLSAGPGAYFNALNFYHRCSELAYKKHHATLTHDEKTNQLIENLRTELVKRGQGV